MANKAITALWAKKAVYHDCEYWLPLLTHLQDTSQAMIWLYDNWLNPAQQKLIAGKFSNAEIRPLISFLGFFHDFGKATPTFQAKPSYQRNQQLDQDILNKLIKGNLTELAKFNSNLDIRRHSPHAIAGEAFLENAGLNLTVGSIIGGHHGMPANNEIQSQVTDYTSNYYSTDSMTSQAAQKWQSIYNDLISFGLHFSHYQSLSDIPSVNESQAILLEGLLIMADWLASSEEYQGKSLFPLIPLQDNYSSINEKQRFQDALQNWPLNDHWQPQPVQDITDLFQKRWNFLPHDTQLKMIQTISNIKDPGLIIIESGCGTGKTEIALASVEELANKTSHNGLFMGLPTQATSNAMFNRVESWLDNIAKNDKANLELNLMHGKAFLNSNAQALPQASNIDNNQGTIVANDWFSGKKAILTEFTVATVDHLLMMSLKQKHLFLRHLALSGKIVIIDEIHAYDTYMTSYLERTLKWLGAYHVPVIALSATLPSSRRYALIKAYCRGKYHKRPANKLEYNNAYPLLTYLDGNQIYQETDFEKQESKAVTIKRLSNDDQILINKIITSIKKGGIAGVIVNTVKRSQQIAQALKSQDVPVLLLHSAFLATDRSRLENKLTSLIGKHGHRPQKLVVVGTQVLEQSLDIDFDVLFTDIAPVDLIIQRIGRLHRHHISRPANLQSPQVYLTGIDSLGNYGKANSFIYNPYILTKTDYFLPEQLTLPSDTVKLIQQVYNENNDNDIPCAQLTAYHRNLAYQKQSEKRKAQSYQLDNPDTLSDLHGWLASPKQNADLDENVAQATVRDITPTIEVILLQKKANNIFTTSHQNIKELTDKQLNKETIRLPAAITKNKLNEIIETLTEQTKKDFPQWQHSKWLHNAITLQLNDNMQAKLNGYTITYNSQLGLIYQK